MSQKAIKLQRNFKKKKEREKIVKVKLEKERKKLAELRKQEEYVKKIRNMQSKKNNFAKKTKQELEELDKKTFEEQVEILIDYKRDLKGRLNDELLPKENKEKIEETIVKIDEHIEKLNKIKNPIEILDEELDEEFSNKVKELEEYQELLKKEQEERQAIGTTQDEETFNKQKESLKELKIQVNKLIITKLTALEMEVTRLSSQENLKIVTPLLLLKHMDILNTGVLNTFSLFSCPKFFYKLISFLNKKLNEKDYFFYSKLLITAYKRTPEIVNLVKNIYPDIEKEIIEINTEEENKLNEVATKIKETVNKELGIEKKEEVKEEVINKNEKIEN